jgi:transmembrane sensor
MLSIMILGGFVWHWLEGETYKTQAGEWRPLRFEDGSFVRLSEQSEIRVSFSKNRRQIELVRGEALFDVARDERRPLFVKSGTAEIQALGTRFDVTRRGGPTRVDVVDGSVRVNVISDASPPWLGSPTGAEASTHQEFNEHTRVLKKNEGATVEGQVIIPSDEADVRRIVDEQSYALDYDRQRLSIVAAQFNTYNRRQLRIADRAAGEKRISGTYRADHPEGLVLAILDMYPDLTVRETEDGWVVEERKR